MVAIPSMPGGGKNVLLIGDEDIRIYDVAGKSVRLVEKIEWATPDFEYELLNIIKSKCKRKPIIMLYDMVEQHYRKDFIPKVSPLDKSSVLSRKIAVTFPNYQMRGALPVKDTRSREQKQADSSAQKGAPYLFAAIPSSELISAMMRAIVQSGYPIGGLYLLPIESVSMVGRLLQKFPMGEAQSARWTLFMGQHSGGSLRQIVVRDGDLALTRMTPFASNTEDLQTWAKDLHQEYKATASYLSRLGFQSEEGINIIIIGDEDAISETEHLFGDNVYVSVVSTEGAAQAIGADLGFDYTGGNTADVLHAAWAAQKTSMAMPIKVRSISDANTPRRIAAALLAAMFCGFLYLAYEAVTQGSQYASVSSELRQTNEDYIKAEADLNRLIDEQKELGVDIRRFRGAFAAHEALNDFTLRPFSILSATGAALGGDLTIDSVQLRHSDESKIDFFPLFGTPGSSSGARSNEDGPEVVANLDGTITISFSERINIDVGNRTVNLLATTIQSNLDERFGEGQFRVLVDREIQDLSYGGVFEGQIGGQEEEGPQVVDDFSSIIKIEGSML